MAEAGKERDNMSYMAVLSSTPENLLEPERIAWWKHQGVDKGDRPRPSVKSVAFEVFFVKTQVFYRPEVYTFEHFFKHDFSFL